MAEGMGTAFPPLLWEIMNFCYSLNRIKKLHCILRVLLCAKMKHLAFSLPATFHVSVHPSGKSGASVGQAIVPGHVLSLA